MQNPPPPHDLVPLIEAVAEARVMCVGDVMLDRFVYGTVERISPEAPIPVLRVTGDSFMPGAAGNVAANLVALGAHVHLVSVAGADDAGSRLAGLIEDGIGEPPALVVQPGRETSLKTRYIAEAQQLLRADRETVLPIATETADRLLAEVQAGLPACGAMILSDYGKGVLAPPLVGRLIEAAHDAGKPVIVDPKGRDFSRYRNATVVTPNRRELAEAAGMPAGDDAQVVAAARHLLAADAFASIVVTRSEQGMTLVAADDGAPMHLRAESREVYDVSGAGDTVVATLAAVLAAAGGFSRERLVAAARLANLAGGIVVGKAGTAVVHVEELLAALHHEEWVRGEAKVVGLAAAAERVRRWRSRNLRVGFTNGCFDLLHPGHVSLIRQARAACDRLIVGLNSDASIRRLKGAGRPVQTEAARSAVLASLEAVDLVVIFGEDTPLHLIETLRPEILVKGADYAMDQVVGGDTVRGYGGQVLLASLEEGHSTTATIARMRR